MVCQVKLSYFDSNKPLIIPHRGGANIVPENTLHALQTVSNEKFSHFETDLRMSKDGEVFLQHDETFDRTTNTSGLVGDFLWKDISKINAGYKFYRSRGLSEMSTRFVTLLEALTKFPDLKFNLDLKQSGMDKKVTDIIFSLKAESRVLVSSFSPKRLDNFIKVSKGRILTSGSFRENLVARFLPSQKRNIKVNAIQAPFRWRGVQVHSSKLLNFCKLNNIPLHIWTVNSIDVFKKCLEIGCDGVITDEPIILREYLRKKN